MAMTLHDLLHPQVVLDVVSRVRKNQGRMGKWFGFHVNGFDAEKMVLTGPSVKQSPTRSGSYRIFDRTRTVAKARAPGTGPAVTSPQAVGSVDYTACRFHEKIPLDMEVLANLSTIVGPNTVLDEAGEDYVVEQKKHLATRFNNAVEIMTAGMIRGTLYLKVVGQDFIPVLADPGTPKLTIDFKVPAGNKSKLNMLGAGDILAVSWSNPAAKIISEHLPKISQAMAQLHGYPLTDIFVDPITWGYVMLNTEVINSAGSANTPFNEFEYTRDKGDDGKQLIEWVAVLRGYPTVRWHIVADVLVADGGTDPSYAAGTGTLTQVLPANYALFLPEVDTDWVDIIHCAEHVSDAPGLPAVKRPGMYFWNEWTTQPTTVDLIGLFNAIPRLKVPKAMALGNVVY